MRPAIENQEDKGLYEVFDGYSCPPDSVMPAGVCSCCMRWDGGKWVPEESCDDPGYRPPASNEISKAGSYPDQRMRAQCVPIGNQSSQVAKAGKAGKAGKVRRVRRVRKA